jgi:sterol 3beta-glucosyltransferase
MKITVFTAGSRGDIQPCLALGRGLQESGYQVTLAAPADFGDFVRTHEVCFRPLRGDVRRIMASDTGRKFLGSGGGNPLRSIRAIRTLLAPVVRDMAQDAYEACCDADGIICLGVLSPFGRAIADVLGIPIIHLEPTPLLPTRAFPAPSWPVQRNLGGPHNRFSGWAMLQVVRLWYEPFVKAFRVRLGLPPGSAKDFHRALRSTPMLGAYSPELIPHPPDWPESLHITGYFFLDEEPNRPLPPALEAFLAAGNPPVCIGFGSMGGREPERLASLVLEALAKSGLRGVILTGWGGLRTATATADVLVLDSAPHSQLFPHTAAVVHHGGAGTTAEGLRAGVPNVIVPFNFDQPFWGARVKALGLGPASLPQKSLTADRLAESIHAAVTDFEMRRRAAACGVAIRAENGVGNAVEIVRRYFGNPGPG